MELNDQEVLIAYQTLVELKDEMERIGSGLSADEEALYYKLMIHLNI